MIEFFDIREYLEDKNIPYHTSGKNVTSGWIEIQCVFCDDPSAHLGISPEMKFNCWRCGEKGTVLYLLQVIEGGVSEAQINTMIKKYQLEELPEKVERNEAKGPLKIPGSKELGQIHWNYLVKRNFSPTNIREKYDVRAGSLYGKFKYRLIIPVRMNGRIVNYVGRDVTNKMNLPYKNCPNEEAIIPIKNCLYNYDEIKENCFIVEGIFDVWRMQDAVALFGIEWTTTQLNLLKEKNFERIWIMFDGEPLAFEKANKLGETLDMNGVGKEIQVVELDEGRDPANLSEEEANEWRRKIFQK